MANSEYDPENALLLKAFNTFSEASLQLEKAYSDLRNHTRELDMELKETNEKLTDALRDQERVSLHLRSVLNSLTTGIMVIDLEGVLLDINPCGLRLLGIESRQVHYSELNLPEPVAEFLYSCIESTMPRGPRREVTISRDGEQMDLELSFNLVRPEGGGIMSVLILINDNTQINRLQSQSKRNARLAAMGEMSAELAHEIRNPLGSIKLFASLLEKDLENDPDKINLAGQITSGVSVLENIVSNILSFSANVTPKREPVVVGDLLAESLPLFEHEVMKKDIQVDYQAPGESYRIMGDPHLLKQVVLNLCNNAIRAMDPGGGLTIRTKKRDDFVEILISDTGHGIPEDQLHKIFDPFYTTFQGGTGLGLSVVNQIIDKHGGVIDIKSKVGEGTAVSFSIPCLR